MPRVDIRIWAKLQGFESPLSRQSPLKPCQGKPTRLDHSNYKYSFREMQLQEHQDWTFALHYLGKTMGWLSFTQEQGKVFNRAVQCCPSPCAMQTRHAHLLCITSRGKTMGWLCITQEGQGKVFNWAVQYWLSPWAMQTRHPETNVMHQPEYIGHMHFSIWTDK